MQKPHRLGLVRALALFLVAWALPVGGGLAQPEVPERLILRFDPSAEHLDQTQIRSAVQRELGTTLVENGPASSASLTLFVDASGQLTLVYEPERTVLMRSVPVSTHPNLPVLVAQLAGNLVRDEAYLVIASLTPPPTPPLHAETNPPVNTAPDPAAPPSLPAGGAAEGPAPWALTMLFGGAYLPSAHGVATLQVSRRLGAVEFGLAAEFSAGRTTASHHYINALAGDPTRPAIEQDLFSVPRVQRDTVAALEFTVPLSLDVDLFRRPGGYLQVGASVGFRLVGAFLKRGHLSGSEGDVALAARVTAGVHVRERSYAVLRGTWGLLPREVWISGSDHSYSVEPFGSSIQLGYVIGF